MSPQCQSFHFAPRWIDETFVESIKRFEYHLCSLLQMTPGKKVCHEIWRIRNESFLAEQQRIFPRDTLYALLLPLLRRLLPLFSIFLAHCLPCDEDQDY